MTSSSQGPPIHVAQETEHAQRLLAAQARLYTDADQIHYIRIVIVVALALLTITTALALPEARSVVGSIGGAITFLFSVLGSGREKRRRKEAAFVQEEFDTYVFDLPWNDFAADRPSPTVVAEAAARYTEGRTHDWYPNTDPVVRPLDVLICQRSNLGWGSSMHRFYAAILSGVLVLLAIAGVVIAIVVDLSFADALIAILVPLLGPAKELIELIKANRDSTDTKSKTETKILTLWNKGLQTAGAVTITDCRAVQDRILAIRQTNAQIPDRLDKLRRDRSETVMRASADHLIEQALQQGRTRPGS